MAAPEVHPLTLAEDEKSAAIMVYTQQFIYWGEIVLKNSLRASTLLRTNAAPEVVQLFNARAIMTTHPGTPHPVFSHELLIFTSQILAYHLIPPQQDPLDYDPTEPNRTMFPVIVRVGPFKFDGSMRLSSITSPAKYLTITREEFTGLYNLEISNPLLPELGVLKVPFALVRQTQVIYTIK